jgi:hypothetical protein
LTGSSELPPLDALQRLLLPVADRFMVLMWSRPPSGTLRDTRVTLVSLVLAALTVLLGGPGGVALIAAGFHAWWLIPVGLIAELVALGSLALLLYGVRQRR